MSVVQKKDILIVDDDGPIRELLRISAVRAGLTCDAAGDGVEALEHCQGTAYSIVLTDLMMPRLNGAGLVKELAALDRTRAEHPVIILMTAFPEGDRLSEVEEQVHAIVRKPFSVTELVELVQGCLRVRQGMDASGLRT